jgi:hypothetical protein
MDDDKTKNGNVVPHPRRLLVAAHLKTEEDIQAFMDQLARKAFADFIQTQRRSS